MHLSRELIVDAAIALLDEYGLADTTMRRVASSLDSAPGALYWHVANKQALIAAIARRIIDASHLPQSPSSPVDFATALRARLLAHRDGAEVVLAGLSQPGNEDWLDLVTALSSLLPTQLPDADRTIGATAILHLVLGATTMEQAQRQLVHDTQATASAPKTTAPNERPGAQHDTQPVDAATALARGVDVILTGLSAQ